MEAHPIGIGRRIINVDFHGIRNRLYIYKPLREIVGLVDKNQRVFAGFLADEVERFSFHLDAVNELFIFVLKDGQLFEALVVIERPDSFSDQAVIFAVPGLFDVDSLVPGLPRPK